jgi:hypothetical protein
MTYAHLPEPIIDAWPTLSFKAKDVAVALACFMNGDGRCFVLRETLMTRMGTKRPQNVTDGTRELEHKGLLKVRQRVRQCCLYEWAIPESTHGVSSGLSESTPSVPSELPESTHGVPRESTPCVPHNIPPLTNNGLRAKKRASPKKPKQPSDVTVFKRWWELSFQDTQRCKYAWVHEKHGGMIKRLLKQVDLSELKSAAQYLLDGKLNFPKEISIEVLVSKNNELRRLVHAAEPIWTKDMQTAAMEAERAAMEATA